MDRRPSRRWGSRWCGHPGSLALAQFAGDQTRRAQSSLRRNRLTSARLRTASSLIRSCESFVRSSMDIRTSTLPPKPGSFPAAFGADRSGTDDGHRNEVRLELMKTFQPPSFECRSRSGRCCATPWRTGSCSRCGTRAARSRPGCPWVRSPLITGVGAVPRSRTPRGRRAVGKCASRLPGCRGDRPELPALLLADNGDRTRGWDASPIPPRAALSRPYHCISQLVPEPHSRRRNSRWGRAWIRCARLRTASASFSSAGFNSATNCFIEARSPDIAVRKRLPLCKSALREAPASGRRPNTSPGSPTAEGDSSTAAAALIALSSHNVATDSYAVVLRALLELGFAWRFLPEAEALRRTEIAVNTPAAQSSPDLGAGPRLLPTFDAPRGAVALGRILAASDSRDLKRSGLIAQTLGSLALGR